MSQERVTLMSCLVLLSPHRTATPKAQSVAAMPVRERRAEMSTTVGSFTPPARSVPPIRDPRPIDQRTEGSRTWRDDVEEALKARRVGAQLREGKPKSFRPVVGKI